MMENVKIPRNTLPLDYSILWRFICPLNGSTPSFKDASSTRQPIPIGSSLLRLSTAFLFVVPAAVSRAILYCNTIFVGAAID